MDVEIFIFFGWIFGIFLKKHKEAYAQKYTTSAGGGGGRMDVDLRTKQKCLLMHVFVF